MLRGRVVSYLTDLALAAEVIQCPGCRAAPRSPYDRPGPRADRGSEEGRCWGRFLVAVAGDGGGQLPRRRGSC